MNIKKYTLKYENLAKKFKCGNIVIDNFLQDGRALDENQGITYILLSDEEDRIVGYYNIEVGRVDQIQAVGENRYFLPMGGSVNINYLAVDKELQGIQIAEIGERNKYEDFEEDMSTFIKESDRGCHQLYKWVDDIVDIKKAG